ALDSEIVAIELKYTRCTRWRGTYRGVELPNPSQADAVPYEFLKDIHRMERLVSVRFGAGRVVPRYRVCALLSNNPFETDGQTLHERMRLRPRILPSGHLVQFNELTVGG